MNLITVLTTVKVWTLRDVAVGSKNQLHILNNALATEREGEVKREKETI